MCTNSRCETNGYFRTKKNILPWIPGGDNVVTPTVNAFHTVAVNSEHSIQIPIVSDDCHYGNGEQMNAIIPNEITIWEYIRCLFVDDSTCITTCTAQANEEKNYQLKTPQNNRIDNYRNAFTKRDILDNPTQPPALTNRTRRTDANLEMTWIFSSAIQKLENNSLGDMQSGTDNVVSLSTKKLSVFAFLIRHSCTGKRFHIGFIFGGKNFNWKDNADVALLWCTIDVSEILNQCTEKNIDIYCMYLEYNGSMACAHHKAIFSCQSNRMRICSMSDSGLLSASSRGEVNEWETLIIPGKGNSDVQMAHVFRRDDVSSFSDIL